MNIELINTKQPGQVKYFIHELDQTHPCIWLKCDGSYVSKDIYPKLHNVISTIYGDYSGNDFKLPDFRGYFLRGTTNEAELGRIYNQGVLNHKHTITLNDSAHHHTFDLTNNAGGDGGHIGDDDDLGRGRTDKGEINALVRWYVPGGHSITIQKINSSGIDKTETRPNNYAFIAYIKS